MYWNNYSCSYQCFYYNRIVFLYIFAWRTSQTLVFCCCVLLRINIHFMHDLLLCWFSPFRQMTLAEKRLLGAHASQSPLPIIPTIEIFAFSQIASTRLYEVPLTSVLTSHQSLQLILSFSSHLSLIFHITFCNTSAILHIIGTNTCV